jgi:uncharacterized membrane protein YgcG
MQQAALLLPLQARRPGRPDNSPAVAVDTLQRSSYAHSLNVAFAQQQQQQGGAAGAAANVAALLSLQVLLSLDPHGARVQPRQELLYYTPAGFHVAVCKTLMNGLQPQLPGRGPLSITWSQAALPVWYVWWHIGLLAYQQTQKQQQGRPPGSSGGSSSGSSGGRSSGGSSSGSSGGSGNNGGGMQALYDNPDAR